MSDIIHYEREAPGKSFCKATGIITPNMENVTCEKCLTASFRLVARLTGNPISRRKARIMSRAMAEFHLQEQAAIEASDRERGIGT